MAINNQNFNPWHKRTIYFVSFFKHGILLNPLNGDIRYLPFSPKCNCAKLQIMRHGKTIGTEKKEFMSDDSLNSTLSKEGIKEIQRISENILKDLPDEIIVATINRTKQTYAELKQYLPEELPIIYLREMRGINNGIWAGKTFEMLDENNLIIFLQRECAHNVFIKSENGDSWADVIYRCTKVLKKLNKDHKNKKVLLISQGSIYQGLKILLHIDNSPWETYSADKMFNLSQSSSENIIKYGNILSLH